MALHLIAILFLLLMSSLFEGAEAAYLAVSDIRIKTLIGKGNHNAATVEWLKKDIRRLLGTLLLGQTITDISAISLATYVATSVFGDIGVGLATGAMTVIVLIFVNLIPKSFAARNPEKWSLTLAAPIKLLTTAIGPLVRLIDKFVRLIVRDEVGGATHGTVVSEDEIRTMAQMGVTAGTLEKGEKELIERVFLFNDITAFDVMTPREGVIFLDGKKTVAEALPVISSSGFSRYPVFENEKSNIVGVIHIKNIIKRLAENSSEPLDKAIIKDLAEPATFVPKTKPIDDLLREMQKQHLHMAMVVNEYGSIVGVVSFEDLLEELVGEIADESDVDDLTIKRVDKLNIVAHGDVDIKDVNRFFNVKIEAPPHKSLGWAILKELGSIPGKGQQIKLSETVTATIEEMINLRINKVRLTKTEDQSGGG